VDTLTQFHLEKTWILTGTHTYTGATAVKEGCLIINGTIGAGSALAVDSGAISGGNGTIKRSVSAAGIISPGNSGTGKLRTGALTLSSSSILNFETGTTITV
jgi:fibronectin-binding autotransporter adhesin